MELFVMVCCVLLVSLLVFVTESRPGQPCAIFEFPALNNSTLTANENSTIILPFQINVAPECNLSDRVTIRVRMLQGGQFGDFCSIRQFPGSCHALGGCGCGNGTGIFQLKKTADRIDSTQWLFTTDDGMVQDKEITFNILYAATVERVTLMSDHPDKLSAPVEPGVPEFDTGNLTNITFSLEQSLEMEFHVRTFTTDITDCQMVQKAGLIELRIALQSSSRDIGSGNVLNEKKPESQTDASQIPIHWITIGSVVGAVGLVGCVCLSIVMACRRKGGKDINPPMDVELDRQDHGSSRITEHDPPVAGPSGVQGCRESGVYWEIEDVEVLPQGDPAPPEGAHDDYLHAVPTASDVYERPAQPDYLHAVPAASDIYERPAQPEYSHLNLLYEPLRNVYDNLALRVRRIFRN
ncbi:hypothetical protein BaRGS_00037674 [Batillaria attramentaria]|uniref:CUB domain-containing protein n=1 Tax=Batillaria attramentaria TaxID=370345 RepID=A0ABD0J842_9CAEN